MADLSINFKGIKSPNPFWVASGPPCNKGYQAKKAFEAGWGGVVWKTIGNPIVNTSSRYGSVDYAGRRMMGFNNIELISDRSLKSNLQEITDVKKEFPDRAVIVSVMVESKEEWKEIIRRIEDTGADGLELNFGCPHGMCERGMGSAVGQEPKILKEITSWVKEFTQLPTLLKLTPNISDITEPGLAAVEAQADGVSLINTLKSVMGVDLDDFIPYPKGRGASGTGGYCGPAVKPIALQMVTTLAGHPNFTIDMSGIGGISDWKDAAEFIAMGCTSVQVCTAIMHYGFRIVEDMISGLNSYLDSKGMKSVSELKGKAVPQYRDWGDLDLNYKTIAKINSKTCIGCQLCYISCEDGAHQAISLPSSRSIKRTPIIKEEECVGCNLCSLVCPVPDCIEMVDVSKTEETESWNQKLQKGNLTLPDGVF